MKAHDPKAVSVLRTTLAAIANAEAVDATASVPRRGLFANETARRQLSVEEIREVVADQRRELEDAAAELHKLGRVERAEELTAGAAVLDSYLVD